MKKPTIKFENDHKCLWGQTKGKLLDVTLVTSGKIDSMWGEYNAPTTPTGLLLVLTFSGDKMIPFGVIRKATSKTQGYYERNIGQWFDIVIDPEKVEEKEHVDLFEGAESTQTKTY